MPNTLKKLRIFVASPSDVANERAKLETVVTSLKPIADYLGLTLEVVHWRAVVPDTGRAQQIIFDQLKPTSWDIFVGILWHRFGTPPGGKDPQTQKDYLSGTEEEFREAFRLQKQFGKPRIVMYRCTRAIPTDSLDLDQYKRVTEFFKELESIRKDNAEGTHPGLYQSFDTSETFERLLLDNLQKLLIDYSEQSKTPITPEVIQVLAPKIPNNLPRRAAFFGRAKEMEVVMRALSPADRTWGVLVDGIGGIGKTTLAIEAAHRAQEMGAFDAFVFVAAKQNILAPSGIRKRTPTARTLDDFLNETARVLGQPGISKLEGDDKRRALLDMLRAMRALLIYDNPETLSKEEQEATADFLRELPPGCKAIITSRRRGGEGAVWLRVEQLDWDAARGIIENEMKLDTGLANKLRRVESRWQELYDETNGSPLALVHTLGLMRVRAALTFDGALEMLRGNRDEDLQTFIFQETRKELTANDKTALGALSFFVPSATFEAWLQVAEMSRGALATTIDRLSAVSLVDVLAREEERYALHPITRAFVRKELLADASTAHEAGMRFAEYWVSYAEQYGESKFKTYERLEAEWANLETAANWLWDIVVATRDAMVDKDAAQLLNDLARALWKFLWFSGYWDERVQLNSQAYDAMRAIEDWSNAGRQAFLEAFVHYNRGHTDDAALWADRCAEVGVRGGDKREQASATRMRGLVARQRKDYDESKRLLKEALDVFRDFRDESESALALNNLGGLARECRDYEVADQYYHEALKLAVKRRDKELQGGTLGNLGELALEQKQWAEARKWFEKQLSLEQEIGGVTMLAEAKYGIARVWEAEGRADLALPLAQEALTIYERLQHKYLAEAREFVERLKKKTGGM